jgi:hypothetical protein
MCGWTGAKEAFLLQGVWVLCAIKVPAPSRRLSETTLDSSTTSTNGIKDPSKIDSNNSILILAIVNLKTHSDY